MRDALEKEKDDLAIRLQEQEKSQQGSYKLIL